MIKSIIQYLNDVLYTMSDSSADDFYFIYAPMAILACVVVLGLSSIISAIL